MAWIRSKDRKQLIDCKCLEIHDCGRAYDIREHTSHGIYTIGTYFNQQEAENELDKIIRNMDKYEKEHYVMQL